MSRYRILTTTLVVLALSTGLILGVRLPTADALLDLSKYESLESLESDLDKTFKEVEEHIRRHVDGPIPYIDLTHLRNLLQARHQDYQSLFMFNAGRPISRDEVEYSMMMDEVLAKYDDQIVELFQRNLDRFEPFDRDEVETILRILTEKYEGFIEEVQKPNKAALDQEEYEEQYKEYLWYLVGVAIYERNYEEALRLLESEDVGRYIEDPGSRLMLIGALRYYYEDYAQALEHFERALPLLPRESSGWFVIKQKDLAERIAEIYAGQLNDYERADEFYAIAYRDASDDADLLNSYAWFLLDKKDDIERARPLIEKALEEEPDDPYILDTYGFMLMREEKRSEAATYFRKALGAEDLNSEARKIIEEHLRETEVD